MGCDCPDIKENALLCIEPHAKKEKDGQDRELPISGAKK
jgi:hypothetical protein